MKNNKRYITVALLIVFMTFGAMSLCAKDKTKDKKDQIQLYDINKEDANSAFKKISGKYSKGDSEKQSLYENVFVVAFDRYWNFPEIQAPVGPNTIEDVKAQAVTLKEKLNAKGNPQADLDSLQYLVERYLALKDTIVDKHERLDSLQNELGKVHNQIADNNSKLDQFQNQADAVSKKEKDLNRVISNLLLAYNNAKSKNDFSAVNEVQIDNAVKEYKASRGAIQSVLKKNVEPYDRTVEALVTLKAYKDLLAKSEEAMAGKYDPKTNEKLLNQFNELASQTGPTDGQRAYVDSIIKSLQNEGAAVDSFCSIFDSILETVPCVPDDDERDRLELNKVIIQGVQEFNNSIGKTGDTYDPLYVQLNLALKQVTEDLSPDSKMPIIKINDNDRFPLYLQSIKDLVK